MFFLPTTFAEIFRPLLCFPNELVSTWEFYLKSKRNKNLETPLECQFFVFTFEEAFANTIKRGTQAKQNNIFVISSGRTKSQNTHRIIKYPNSLVWQIECTQEHPSRRLINPEITEVHFRYADSERHVGFQ